MRHSIDRTLWRKSESTFDGHVVDLSGAEFSNLSTFALRGAVRDYLSQKCTGNISPVMKRLQNFVAELGENEQKVFSFQQLLDVLVPIPGWRGGRLVGAAHRIQSFVESYALAQGAPCSSGEMGKKTAAAMKLYYYLVQDCSDKTIVKDSVGRISCCDTEEVRRYVYALYPNSKQAQMKALQSNSLRGYFEHKVAESNWQPGVSSIRP